MQSDARTHETDVSDRAAQLIDWDMARSGARRLAPTGPRLTPEDAGAAVQELRASAVRAVAPVAETARLQAPGSANPARVVDRGRWIDVNVESFAHLLDPLARHLLARQVGGITVPGQQIISKVGGVMTGAEMAGLLAFLSGKILGQYDVAPGREASAAQLLLVAPNIVAVERQLNLDPSDFRLWVCLHEETHRVQFTAVPWLRDHLLTTTQTLAEGLAPDPAEVVERLKALPSRAKDALAPGSTGLAELFTTPEQRSQIAAVSAVMALLEGHAEVVTDDVGPQVVPSVATIRERFDRRREGLGFFDVVIRRLLGLEAKMAQYRDGAGFVRGVTAQVGVDGFNAVWTSPETLPTPSEIADPRAWVRRVHG